MLAQPPAPVALPASSPPSPARPTARNVRTYYVLASAQRDWKDWSTPLLLHSPRKKQAAGTHARPPVLRHSFPPASYFTRHLLLYLLQGSLLSFATLWRLAVPVTTDYPLPLAFPLSIALVFCPWVHHYRRVAGPAGKFAADTGSIACTDAPPGSYQDKAGQTAALACDVGSYAPSSGMTQCLPAPLGAYVAQQNSTTFVYCAAGSYADTIGTNSTCRACPANHFSEPGAAACTPCPAGYGSVEGSASCVPCLAGQTSTAGGGCQACNRGTYAPVNGSSSCAPCPKRTFAAATGMVECELATAG